MCIIMASVILQRQDPLGGLKSYTFFQYYFSYLVSYCLAVLRGGAPSATEVVRWDTEGIINEDNTWEIWARDDPPCRHDNR